MGLNFETLKISKHAVRAMAERAVEIEDLAEVLLRPAVVEPHEGKRRFVGRSGLVAVVAGPDASPVLVTVLLRSRDQWTNEDVRNR